MTQTTRLFVLMLSIAALAPAVFSQQSPKRPEASKAKKIGASAPAEVDPEVDPMEEVRRTTAISLVNSLADEARMFRDPALRSRVQGGAADALWETDAERARLLFRRAWDEAESADAENERRVEEERGRQVRAHGHFSLQLPPSLRAEILRLAAKRDNALGEEFLKRMEQARKDEVNPTNDASRDAASGDGPPRRPDPTFPSDADGKRLLLARQLLQDGSVESAIKFADPALTHVSGPALQFLALLRQKNAAAADERYALLLRRAAADSNADANVASLLSSYIFTPSIFFTFGPEAGSISNSFGDLQPPTDIAPQLRAAYFNTAAEILLRPIPPPDQDRTSSGRAGWYMVIARLLPLFDQYAPDKSSVLRARLAALAPDTPEGSRRPGNHALTRGLVPDEPTRDRVQDALNRLERARTTEDRDAIYADAVLGAVRQKDSRAEEFISKIEDPELRKQLRAFVDYQAAQNALRDKDVETVARLTRSMNLTPIQRVWLLTEAAKLVFVDAPGRALEFLEEAIREARERIDPSAPERPSALVAIATEMRPLDPPRSWEVLLDAIKAANAASEFTGEDGSLTARLRTRSMTSVVNNSVESFDLTGIFSELAREDMPRAISLAQNFENERPRAVATLAIARAILNAKKP